MSRRCPDCGCAISARSTRCVRCNNRHHEPPDPVVVDRLVAGIRTRSTPVERAEAVRLMTAAGLSAALIAQRMGCSRRSVVRFRSRAA